MKYKRQLIIIGCILVLVLTNLACRFSLPGSGKRSDINTVQVKSADGSAVLQIPLEALPSGTKAEDISIELVSGPDEVNAEEAWWVYELTPDGLTFSQPVELIFSFDAGDELPAITAGLFQISESGEVENLEFTQADMLPDGTVNLTSEISHFSKVVLKSFFFEATHFGYPQQPIPVGKEFAVDIILIRKGEFIDFHFKEKTWRAVMVGGWDISGDWFAGSNFNPQERLDQNFSPGNVNEFALTTSWVCTRPSQVGGDGEMIPESIYFKGMIEYQGKIDFLDKDLNVEETSKRELRKEVILAKATPFYCIADEQVDEIPPETPADTVEAVPKESSLTPEPEPIVFEDPVDDPVCCIQCQKTDGDIPDNIDIVAVEYKLLKEWGENKECVHKFTIRTVKPIGDSIGEANISIDDPDLPQAVGEAPHCLEAGVNRTYSVILGGGIVSSSQDGMVLNSDGKTYSWRSQEESFKYEIEGNAVHFYIPCEHLSPKSTWMAWTTDVAWCDEVGYR